MKTDNHFMNLTDIFFLLLSIALASLVLVGLEARDLEKKNAALKRQVADLQKDTASQHEAWEICNNELFRYQTKAVHQPLKPRR